ncbi:MAG: hypothetical protein J4400_00720 [Candidatus Aenigmarchaeota archaeon]|nr:hypothetical protein [Candidatus Aenigmarchaeota archaeon]
MVQELSKVLTSRHREKIIEMMRNKWPLRRIRAWLVSNGEDISLMSLQRFRKRWVPTGDQLPRTYVNQKWKELDLRIDALNEHAKAIVAQKMRASKIWEQEEKLGVVFPQGRKEMALLSKMLFDHHRMKEGIVSLISSQEPEHKVIEVRWLRPGEKSDDDKEKGKSES